MFFDGWRRQSAERRQIKALRRRLLCSSRGDAQLRDTAARLRELREEVSHALGDASACAECARGKPPPNGRWDGGFCCGGSTDDVFTSQELAALYQAGTRPRHLRVPAAVSAGCIFRGPTGCSLPPAHRPTICLTFLCRDLLRELHERGDLAQVDRLRSRLEREWCRFLDLL